MRKRKPKVRVVQPDTKYGDVMVTQFVNNLMWNGKKGGAFKLFYDALAIVKEKIGEGESEHETWKKALTNVIPQVEVRSKRIGGATFQIPTQIRPKRKVSTGMKWMIKYSRERSGKGMAQKLAAEIIAASNGEGGAVKRKENTHKMAEANKAFAHFRV